MGDLDSVAMLRKMVLIRRFEAMVKEAYTKGRIHGYCHLSTGEEGVAVGICHALEASDVILSNHRGHGLNLAKGADPRRLLAEVFGKATGFSRGKGGSMHVADFRAGVWGGYGVVAENIPLAAGIALAFKYREEERVVVPFFGDGAVNTGAFHEGLNLASILELPVIFVCVNNQFAVSTRPESVTSVERISDRALAYSLEGVSVDGNDVLEVHRAAVDAAARARKGGGPCFIEARTYRMEGHFVGDPEPYREKEELELWRSRDPIVRLRTRLTDENSLSEDKWQEIEEEVSGVLREAMEFVESSPEPDLQVLGEGV